MSGMMRHILFLFLADKNSSCPSCASHQADPLVWSKLSKVSINPVKDQERFKKGLLWSCRGCGKAVSLEYVSVYVATILRGPLATVGTLCCIDQQGWNRLGSANHGQNKVALRKDFHRRRGSFQHGCSSEGNLPYLLQERTKYLRQSNARKDLDR